MPGFGGTGARNVPTPGRTHQVIFDPDEKVLQRPSWRLRREADHIKRSPLRGVSGGLLLGASESDLRLLPGPAWVLNPLRGENASLTKADYSDCVVPVGSLSHAPNMVAVNMWRPPTELSGLGLSGALAGALIGYKKRVPAGAVWDGGNNSLTADTASHPMLPDPASQLVPMDRVLAGAETYGANMGWGFTFTVEPGYGAPDGLINFYFGGPVAVRNALPLDQGGTSSGGEFGLQVRANGWAILYEKNFATWEERHRFPWADPAQIRGGNHAFWIYPYGHDRIVFFSQAGEGGEPSVANIWRVAGRRPTDTRTTYYHEAPRLTGHFHPATMTGEGTFRVDIRRDYCHPVVIFTLKHPNTATLIDAPFQIDYPMPANTVIGLGRDLYDDLGGTITTAIYNAADDTALTPDGTGNGWLSVAGQQRYYARFTFTAAADRFGRARTVSPVLFGYTVYVDQLTTTRTGGNLTGGNLRSVSITGPGLAIDEESCSLVVKDMRNQLPRLRNRDRVRTRINVVTAEDPRGYVTIFDGRTFPGTNRRRGRAKKPGFTNNAALTDRAWPSASWVDYDPIRCAGMWAYLMEQPVKTIFDFRVDQSAPKNPDTGSYPPWTVTHAIRELLEHVGFESDRYDVPEDPLRLWPSPSLTPDDYLIQVGKMAGEVIQKFALAILGRPFVWDPNVGTWGKWRLLPAAPNLSNVLAEFRLTAPSGSPKDKYKLGAYGASNITWIEDGSYDAHANGPEFNFLIVSATGDLLPGHQGKEKLTQVWVNRESFDPGDVSPPPTLDADNPNYLGYCLPVEIYDPFLKTEEAVNWVGNRVFQFAGHGEAVVKWRSPALFVNDPFDLLSGSTKRLLRINDCVKVNEVKCAVKYCNPDYHHSGLMMADYFGKFVE